MAANLKSYIADPKHALAKKLHKTRAKWERRIRFAGDFLAGNYTGRTIDLDWAAKPTRIDLINKLILEQGYQRYLELGCRGDECFRAVRASHKVGVDPASGGTLRMTSDDFFARNAETFDLIFIDGLHIYEQVLRDITNSAKALSANGTIVMHDCLPLSCVAQLRYQLGRDWNGDVWKAFVQARTMPDLDCATCLIDHGVGIVRRRKNSRPLQIATSDFRNLKYKDLVDHYALWLNTIEFSELGSFIDGRCSAIPSAAGANASFGRTND